LLDYKDAKSVGWVDYFHVLWLGVDIFVCWNNAIKGHESVAFSDEW